MSAPALAVAVLAVAVPLAARASPAALTAADVRELVTRSDCGGVSDATPEGAALRERMVAKFSRESGIRGTDLVHPFAIRDETEGAPVTPPPATREAAVAEALGRLARGHVLGLGMGQITGVKNLLADFGVGDVADAVRLAFRPCEGVRAAVRHYAADLRHAMRVLDCASAAYNAGAARVCQDTAYVRSVRALQAALPVDLARGAAPARPVVPSSPALARKAGPAVDMVLRVVPRAPSPPQTDTANPHGHSARMPEEIASR